MKKLTSLYAMLLMAMMAVTFTSCTDEDEYEAYNLEGAWQGNMGVVVYDEYGYEYVSTRSVIYFNRDPYRYASGEGYQVDYFGSDFRWSHRTHAGSYLANHISWEVRNGIIRIYYHEEDIWAEISEYGLDYETFYGYIDYEDGSSSSFTLYKTSSPNDYNEYYDWGWGYYDYYYGKENGLSFDEGTRAADASKSQMKPRRTAKRANSVEK